ncbi:hypothetical protein AB0H92_11175 [Streptomyces phaeochromogenes]|jgi:hypothetical protein|uniref:hypothetical protein n=1 Tax=Streptomyces phaeochromogenes group TaxID=2838332 RepID=UPI003404D780
MTAQVDEDVPPSTKLKATCRTEACQMNGESITGTYFANAEPPTYRGWCGECDRPITDLVPV